MENIEVDIESAAPEASNPDEPNSSVNDSDKTKSNEKNRPGKLRLPISRVKHLMKMDPDCEMIAHDALLLVVKATELFLESMAEESAKVTMMRKRKIIMRKDVDNVISTVPNLCFLDGALE